MAGWQIGDLALCVGKHVEGLPGDCPRVGVIYMVSHVGVVPPGYADAGAVALGLVGMNPYPYEGYNPVKFRKVPPPAFEEPRVTHQRTTRKETARA